MKRRSKYVGMKFGKWTCVHIGINIATARYDGINYYYVFERQTSDGKCDKQVRLNSSQACKVYRGEKTVEYYSEKYSNEKSLDYTKQIRYRFK